MNKYSIYELHKIHGACRKISLKLAIFWKSDIISVILHSTCVVLESIQKQHEIILLIFAVHFLFLSLIYFKKYKIQGSKVFHNKWIYKNLIDDTSPFGPLQHTLWNMHSLKIYPSYQKLNWGYFTFWLCILINCLQICVHSSAQKKYGLNMKLKLSFFAFHLYICISCCWTLSFLCPHI